MEFEIFGESRSENVGVKIFGLEGAKIDTKAVQEFCNLRRPGVDELSSPRKENDEIIFTSGIDKNGIITGTVIAEIKNTDAEKETEKFVPRPGHADYPAYKKYGHIPAGGGKFSGRMTAPLCIAGGIALQILSKKGITLDGHILTLHGVRDESFDPINFKNEEIYKRDFPVLDISAGEKMKSEILSAKSAGDSVGGTIEVRIDGVPAGTGGNMFSSLDGKIAASVFCVPGIKGIDFGAGFSSAYLLGSENNDGYYIENGKVKVKTNFAGGILGGMATGAPIIFSAAVKPTPSIKKEQDSVNLKTMQNEKLSVDGRNDPCIVKRALPGVISAAALAVLDALEDK